MVDILPPQAGALPPLLSLASGPDGPLPAPEPSVEPPAAHVVGHQLVDEPIAGGGQWVLGRGPQRAGAASAWGWQYQAPALRNQLRWLAMPKLSAWLPRTADGCPTITPRALRHLPEEPSQPDEGEDGEEPPGEAAAVGGNKKKGKKKDGKKAKKGGKKAAKLAPGGAEAQSAAAGCLRVLSLVGGRAAGHCSAVLLLRACTCMIAAGSTTIPLHAHMPQADAIASAQVDAGRAALVGSNAARWLLPLVDGVVAEARWSVRQVGPRRHRWCREHGEGCTICLG